MFISMFINFSEANFKALFSTLKRAKGITVRASNESMRANQTT